MTREQKLDLAAFNEVVTGLCAGIPCKDCPFDDGDVCKMQQWVKQMSIEALQEQADGDLISRNDLRNAVGFLRKYNVQAHDTTMDAVLYDDVLLCINELPSVAIPSAEPKTGHCKDCKWWKDSDGAYRRGVRAESQCPLNRKEVFEGNGYCYMFEPQEIEG